MQKDTLNKMIIKTYFTTSWDDRSAYDMKLADDSELRRMDGTKTCDRTLYKKLGKERKFIIKKEDVCGVIDKSEMGILNKN